MNRLIDQFTSPSTSRALRAFFLTVGISLLGQTPAAHAAVHRSPAATLQARQQWYFKQRAYPLGYIPAGAKEDALAQINAPKTLGTRIASQAPLPWSNIGPAPILNGQISPTGPVSGRITALAGDPSKASHWIAGTAQGGVWETKNGGGTWTPLTDDQASLAIGSIIFAPRHSSTIYAGTGEPNWSADSYAGAGLLKSTNSGKTWQLLGTDVFKGKAISSIIASPSNTNTLLVGVSKAYAGPDGSSPTVTGGYGVFGSTNGGKTWGLKTSGYADDLQVHPQTFNSQLASIADTNTLAFGLRRSFDGGTTWTTIPNPWGSAAAFRVHIAISPSQPDTVYVSVGDGAFDTFGELLGIWRTDNAWDSTPTWTQLPTPDTSYPDGSPEAQMWYDNVVSVDPQDPDTFYFGGIELWQYDAIGMEWTVLGGNYDDSYQGINFHPDQHALAWTRDGSLLIGNDGGVWSTDDGGFTFDNHNTTLSINQFYYGAVHSTGSFMALAGAQDNGTSQWSGGNGWTMVGEGDGAECAISPTNPDTRWALSLDGMQIERTTDGGATVDDVFDPGSFGSAGNVPFIGRMVMAPYNENIVLIADSALIKTTNFMGMPNVDDPNWGDDWYYDSDDLGSGGASITAIAFAPSDKKANIYAWGTGDGQLRMTRTGDGTQAIDLNGNGAIPARYITSIAFDPANANNIYVALSGFDEGTPGHTGHLFRTTNALSASPTWSNVSPPVNIPHNAVVVDPQNSNIIYVGTDIGIWQSKDGAASWTHLGPEVQMPNVAVFDLRIQPKTDRVFAFTHGRGAFMLDPYVTDLVLSATNGPVPAQPNVPYSIDYTIANNGPLDVTNAVFTAKFSTAVNVTSATATQGTPTSTPTNVVCNLGILTNGATAHVIVSMTPLTVGWITNTSSTHAEIGDSFTNDNSLTIVIPVNPTDLAIGTSAPPAVMAGYPFTYTISVTNSGPAAATGVTVVETVPYPVTYLSATTTQGTVSSSGDTVTFNAGYLDPNYIATMTVTVQAPVDPQTMTNKVTVTANEPDVDLSNNTFTTLTDVVPLPPPIYNLSAIGFPTAAIISWNTLSNGTAQVAYGTNSNYGAISSLDATLRTNHTVLLTGLVPDMLYYFKATSVVSGIVYTATGTFTTTATLIMQEPDAAYNGSWTLSSAVGDKYGSFFQYANTSTDTFSPDATATFNAALPVAGRYDVAMWWPSGANHSKNVPVLVSGAGGTTLVTVDQTVGGYWAPLASGVNCPGAAASVEVMNDTGESSKAVIANAVKFSYNLGQDKPTNGVVPAWWSQYYFGTNGVSGSADADGDGYSNFTEFVLGTTPNDPTSELTFSSQATANGLQFTFGPYQGGRIYQLQYRADFNSPWTTLANTPTVDANGKGVFTLSSGLTGFFRLQVSLAP